MTEMPEKTTALPPTPPPQVTPPEKGSKTNYHNGTIGDCLVFAQRVTYGLNNDPDIRRMMEPVGYDQFKINAFTTVYEAALNAHAAQQKEYSDKTGSYAEFEKIYKKAKTDLSCLIKVAKVALKNDRQKVDLLNLNGKKGYSVSDVFTYMSRLYINLEGDSNLLDKMAVYGYNINRVAACRNSFLNAQTQYNKYLKENSEAVEATKFRDERMAELDEWMYDYYALAKVAYLQKNEFSNEQQG